jgi:hydroxymethylbilane synthase
MKKILRLGTRGSPLALVQAETTRVKLLTAHPELDADIELVPIRTSGDWRPEQRERTFLETGGDKGLFTKEIEEALSEGVIDMAVHSMKDIPARIPSHLDIPILLERADARDALIADGPKTLNDLPQGAVVGTASIRRQAQLLAYRPDLRVVPLRGNVDTRLRKFVGGDMDATVLALAGLQRLDLAARVSSVIDPSIMLPSAGQGALGIEIRRDDEVMRKLLQPLHCPATACCIEAERAFLIILDGSCSTPVAALARRGEGDRLTLEVLAAKPDGSAVIRFDRQGTVAGATALGEAMGEEMRRRLPPGFFTAAA